VALRSRTALKSRRQQPDYLFDAVIGARVEIRLSFIQQKRVQEVYEQGEKICPDGCTGAFGTKEAAYMLLDSFKRDIINQLVAADDGRVLQNPLTPYFRAFTGVFDPRMPFTFYFEVKNKPVMLVYDATPIAARSSRAIFVEHCERIGERTLRITNFIQELADCGYLTVNPPDSAVRPSLPPNYENYWRKYKQFYPNLIEGLSFVCFSRLTPRQKLYDVWLKFNPHVLAS
jgi:hypothetical protein